MKNAKVTDWIETKFKNSEIRREMVIRGSKVNVLISPYDIPVALRFAIDAERKRVTIDLRYINSDELTTKVELDNRVSCDVGKSSSRIYSIQFESKEPLTEEAINSGLQGILAELTKTIDALGKRNSELVKGAIKSRVSEFQIA